LEVTILIVMSHWGDNTWFWINFDKIKNHEVHGFYAQFLASCPIENHLKMASNSSWHMFAC
jgi:hypothetical protein